MGKWKCVEWQKKEGVWAVEAEFTKVQRYGKSASAEETMSDNEEI